MVMRSRSPDARVEMRLSRVSTEIVPPVIAATRVSTGVESGLC